MLSLHVQWVLFQLLFWSGVILAFDDLVTFVLKRKNFVFDKFSDEWLQYNRLLMLNKPLSTWVRALVLCLQIEWQDHHQKRLFYPCNSHRLCLLLDPNAMHMHEHLKANFWSCWNSDTVTHTNSSFAVKKIKSPDTADFKFPFCSIVPDLKHVCRSVPKELLRALCK